MSKTMPFRVFVRRENDQGNPMSVTSIGSVGLDLPPAIEIDEHDVEAYRKLRLCPMFFDQELNLSIPEALMAIEAHGRPTKEFFESAFPVTAQTQQTPTAAAVSYPQHVDVSFVSGTRRASVMDADCGVPHSSFTSMLYGETASPGFTWMPAGMERPPPRSISAISPRFKFEPYIFEDSIDITQGSYESPEERLKTDTERALLGSLELMPQYAHGIHGQQAFDKEEDEEQQLASAPMTGSQCLPEHHNELFAQVSEPMTVLASKKGRKRKTKTDSINKTQQECMKMGLTTSSKKRKQDCLNEHSNSAGQNPTTQKSQGRVAQRKKPKNLKDAGIPEGEELCRILGRGPYFKEGVPPGGAAQLCKDYGLERYQQNSINKKCSNYLADRYKEQYPAFKAQEQASKRTAGKTTPRKRRANTAPASQARAMTGEENSDERTLQGSRAISQPREYAEKELTVEADGYQYSPAARTLQEHNAAVPTSQGDNVEAYLHHTLTQQSMDDGLQHYAANSIDPGRATQEVRGPYLCTTYPDDLHVFRPLSDDWTICQICAERVWGEERAFQSALTLSGEGTYQIVSHPGTHGEDDGRQAPSELSSWPPWTPQSEAAIGAEARADDQVLIACAANTCWRLTETMHRSKMEGHQFYTQIDILPQKQMIEPLITPTEQQVSICNDMAARLTPDLAAAIDIIAAGRCPLGNPPMYFLWPARSSSRQVTNTSANSCHLCPNYQIHTPLSLGKASFACCLCIPYNIHAPFASAPSTVLVDHQLRLLAVCRPCPPLASSTFAMSGTFLDAGNTVARAKDGVSWAQFVTSVGVGGTLFVIQATLFQILRSRPTMQKIYMPKTYLVPERQKTDPPDSNPLKWFKKVVSYDDQELIQKCGLDSWLFTRYLWMCLRIFVPASLLILPVLLPLNAVGGSGQENNISGLDQLSWQNVKPENYNRYWGHLVMAIVLIIYCCYVFYDELLNFIKIRQTYLTSPQHRIRASTRTIFVNNIPPELRSLKALDELFDVFPDGIRKIWLNRDYTSLENLVQRRNNFARNLEEAYTDMFQLASQRHKKNPARILETDNDAIWAKYIRPSDRPTKFIPRFRAVRGLRMVPFWLIWPFGLLKSVDKIDYCVAEIDRLGKKIAERSANPEDYKAASSAFIQFNSQVAAHMAVQSNMHHSPSLMGPRILEIAPADVKWDNLNLSWWDRWIRTLLFTCLFVGIILLWGIPITVAGFMSSLGTVNNSISWLGWVSKLPKWVISVIQGVVPQLLVSLLITTLMPILFRWLCKLTGQPTGAKTEQMLQVWYFAFVFVELVLVVSISTGVFSTLSTIFSDPLNIPSVLASNLPKAANFFFSYVILQAFSISSANLMQVGRLIVMGWRKMFNYTPRSVFRNKVACPREKWGSFFPLYTNFAVIGLIYSIISPLILPFNVVMFSLFFIVFKNNNLYVFRNDVDTGGLMYATAIFQLFTGIYFLEIVLIGFFFIVRDDANHGDDIVCLPQAIITIVMLVLTLFYHYNLYAKLHPLIHFLPITLEDDAVIRDKEFADKINTRRSLADDFKPDSAHGDNDNEEGLELDELHRPSDSSTARIKASIDEKSIRQRVGHRGHRRNFTPDTEKLQADYKDIGDLVAGFDDELEDLNMEERDLLVDEAFTNPVLRGTECTIWIPQDDLGIALDEMKRLEKYHDTFKVSTEGADLGRPKFKTNIFGIPPDFEKTWIVEKEL
ncbi:hypothetical protein FH972_021612 [Carpinus fangiana]|uniref:CSC1/OSCA1-like 7TM region domain-containing protein n=1 Tax=Carpinus fangiana TaxID=176857 RepID=A0A5N6KPV2_9ROSI|nr:hypothetical protein FH972_021612 [Carpinus fangiana]